MFRLIFFFSLTKAEGKIQILHYVYTHFDKYFTSHTRTHNSQGSQLIDDHSLYVAYTHLHYFVLVSSIKGLQLSSHRT